MDADELQVPEHVMMIGWEDLLVRPKEQLRLDAPCAPQTPSIMCDRPPDTIMMRTHGTYTASPHHHLTPDSCCDTGLRTRLHPPLRWIFRGQQGGEVGVRLAGAGVGPLMQRRMQWCDQKDRATNRSGCSGRCMRLDRRRTHHTLSVGEAAGSLCPRLATAVQACSHAMCVVL